MVTKTRITDNPVVADGPRMANGRLKGDISAR